MVKEEDCSDSNACSNAEVINQNLIKDEPLDLKPALETERIHSSSSGGHLKSYFVGMGFSPSLVDKVIKEHGEGDANLLLETLFTYSALEKSSSPKASDSKDGLSGSDKEGGDSPLNFTSDDEEMEGHTEPVNVDLDDKRSYLLMMDFSEEEVAMAINNLGENALLTELVDFIVAAQTIDHSKEKALNGLIHIDDGKNKEATTETLFGTMDKTLCLLQMGFTEREISIAVDKLGIDVPIRRLAESIMSTRLPNTAVKEEYEYQNESNWEKNASEGYSKRNCPAEFMEPNASTSDFILKTAKKAKNIAVDDMEASSSKHKQPGVANSKGSCYAEHNFYEEFRNPPGTSWIKEETPNLTAPSHLHSDASWIKDEIPEQTASYVQRNVPAILCRPPYFFYGNVIDTPQVTWKKLSQFLYAVEPEFVNSQSFSAFIRKEGYLHNLPTEKRFHILPKPPMTIEDALPQTKMVASWDTRKQISCINFDSTGITRLCERLGKMMMDSQGVLSKEQQIDTLHQCKTSNLLWVGPHRLSPIEAEQVEQILGYPVRHTEIWGMEPSDRLKVLKYSFQTDTLGYHLSVLKAMYPGGLRVLSIFSGIGGAEVTLHRLGIRLNCVVSVESSETNRKIFKRWWQKTGQPGQLVQMGGVGMLTSHKLEQLMKEYGDFDIVIGANPGSYTSRTTSAGDFSMGMDISLFFEYVRVLQRVRSMAGRSR
ncbi:LOW QUALITY PROTEIN: probable inactive DNA (cytosine-5)-methyltransferase DRM3 [Dioscorea cayenensis subsp. rotundata]|uniref:DNA (cytosine-5-)-methyltransferase n=1 Tax=Dioscorea cayennensis subsp. rotundata TaxID=55577 RepID=A0AB40BPE4_DIOCR|nr:LOW QUALITY PROTEIN: probable inactive DNA (cytosine-5)-methyltransferase DRM3 [Dioscorea cayenensis subsp. rotundata]